MFAAKWIKTSTRLHWRPLPNGVRRSARQHDPDQHAQHTQASKLLTAPMYRIARVLVIKRTSCTGGLDCVLYPRKVTVGPVDRRFVGLVRSFLTCVEGGTRAGARSHRLRTPH